MQKRKTFRALILQNIFGLVTQSAKDRLEIKTFMIIGHDLFESYQVVNQLRLCLIGDRITSF